MDRHDTFRDDRRVLDEPIAVGRVWLSWGPSPTLGAWYGAGAGKLLQGRFVFQSASTWHLA